jgi:hypothetical protein
MSKTVTIQAYQNILDVCLQEYGSLDFLYDLHTDNGLTDFPAQPAAGTVLTVFPERIAGSRRAVAILQQYMIPGTGFDMIEAPVHAALFHDGYLRPDSYLYPDASLLQGQADPAPTNNH